MIKNISLKNFRLFNNLNLDVNNSLIIFSGANATGKTSILEAIYLCSTSKSHRTNDLLSIIKENEEFSICEIDSDKHLKLVLSKSGKSLFINKREIKKISDFIGNLKVVMFSPSDLSLIKGSKADKRHFLDIEISLIDNLYLKASTAYKKLLKERNDLLKNQNIDKKYLDIITTELVRYLDIIYKKRIGFINEINLFLEKIAIELNVEKIELRYNKTYDDDILKSFKKKEILDINTHVTNIGCHRDDFTVLINNHDAQEYASEGQARTICIALKLALKQYITKVTNVEPILLLDDVFAALDKKRIQSLTKYVLNNHQTFITTTSILEIPDELLKTANVLRIENIIKENYCDGK